MSQASPLATLIFWLVMLLTVASGVMVVAAKRILHAAFALAMCFLGVSGIYIFLHADFVAAVQLIVYVGGVIVLVMFAIMFSSHTQEEGGEGGRHLWALGGAGIVGFMALVTILQIIARLHKPLSIQNPHADQPYRHTVGITAQDLAHQPEPHLGLGHLLMGEYMLPFELASIVILAVLIGAVVIVRKETRG